MLARCLDWGGAAQLSVLVVLIAMARDVEPREDCPVCPSCQDSVKSKLDDGLFTTKAVVTTKAMGARAAVAADFDGDGQVCRFKASEGCMFRFMQLSCRFGQLDLVSASSLNNVVEWYKNEGLGRFSPPHVMTRRSNGARIVATGDIDGDGDIDVVSAS